MSISEKRPVTGDPSATPMQRAEELLRQMTVEEKAMQLSSVFPLYVPGMVDQNTTMLWDAVAVYLAYDESLLEIERLPIHVEDDGKLTVSPGAPVIRVATEWRDGDAEAFADQLVDRLQREGRPSADPRAVVSGHKSAATNTTI